MTPHLILRLSLLAVLLTACAPSAVSSPTPDLSIAYTQAFETALATLRPLQPPATLILTDTPIPSPTAVRTPPALPNTFIASQLNPIDTPHAYVQDTCQYLQNKWNSNNAAPGTIAMVVMFHGIIKGQAETDNQISVQDFTKLMNDLHDMGFQAITTQQLADFLYHNAKVPPRSVLLVQDDRHAAQNFTDHFLSYYKEWGWPVVNGWISAFGGADPFLQENVDLSNQGWVDYQAHGVIHNTPMSDNSTDEFLTISTKPRLQSFGRAADSVCGPCNLHASLVTNSASRSTHADLSCTTGFHKPMLTTLPDLLTFPKVPQAMR